MNIPKLKKISGEKTEKIIKTLKEVILLYSKMVRSSKNGGFFCLREPEKGKIFLLRRVGTCNPKKNKKYRFQAAEKTARLICNKTIPEYGGGIRTEKNIIAFSNLSEKGDETCKGDGACMLILALKLGWIDEETAYAISQKRKNEIFEKMFGQLVSA